MCRKCKDTLVNSEEQIRLAANPSEVEKTCKSITSELIYFRRRRSSVLLAKNQPQSSMTRRRSANSIVQADQLQLWSAMSAMLPFVMHVSCQVTEDHSKVTQNTKSEKEEEEFFAKITRKKLNFTATNVM
jgi:hypothetical protein